MTDARDTAGRRVGFHFLPEAALPVFAGFGEVYGGATGCLGLSDLAVTETTGLSAARPFL
jgi:hypothetical protein